MNIEIPIEQRIIFQNWLREQLKALDFYQKRGDFYLIREFMKFCVEKGHPIDEASLGRYITSTKSSRLSRPLTGAAHWRSCSALLPSR